MSAGDLREQVVATARELNASGLSRGTSGNISVRAGNAAAGGFGEYLITPSAVPNDRVVLADIMRLRLSEAPREDVRPRASSEWRIHRDIYAARPDAKAIVHSHPPFGTTVACLRRGIPAFHYMVAVAGGRDIRCAGYATFGTQELSDQVLLAMQDRRACLMSNHGMLAVGETLADALALSIEVEALAEMYWRVLQVGQVPVLDDGEMDVVLAKMRDYRDIRRTSTS